MLKARVITAVVLLTGFIVGLLFLPPLGWLALAAVVAGLGAWEWGGFFGAGPGSRFAQGLIVAGLVGGVGVIAGLGTDDISRAPLLTAIYLVSAVFWLGCVPWWLRNHWQLRSRALAGLVGLLVLVPAGLSLAHIRQSGATTVIMALATVWLADSVAYFVGRALGRRKLAPGISPGKSWEGAIGGAGAVAVYGLVLWTVGLGRGAGFVELALVILSMLAFTGLSIEGDLFESLLKRQAGVKDSGRILPGHGGVLDRIDSLTSTLPVVALALIFLFPS